MKEVYQSGDADSQCQARGFHAALKRFIRTGDSLLSGPKGETDGMDSEAVKAEQLHIFYKQFRKDFKRTTQKIFRLIVTCDPSKWDFTFGPYY